MKNVLRTLISFLIFLLPAMLHAQETTVSGNPDEKIQVEKKASRGTYQFLVSETNSQFVFKDDILIQIEKLRKENEEVIFSINSTIKVRILSKSEIMKADFKPVDEIIYESDKNVR